MTDNSNADNELITMGMNLGIYTFAKLSSEGVESSSKGWKILADHCANQLENQTGMPAEDLALGVEPTIKEMLEKINAEAQRKVDSDE